MSDKTVSITVKIKDKVSPTIKKIKQQIRSIQDRLDVKLQIDDNGQIDFTKSELADIDNLIQILVDVKDGDLTKAMAKAKALDGMRTRSKHIVDLDTNTGIGIDRLLDGNGSWLWDGSSGGFDPPGTKLTDKTSYVRPPIRRAQQGAVNHMFSEGAVGSNVRLGRKGSKSMKQYRTPLKKKIPNLIDGMDKKVGKLDGSLKKMMPSVHKWMQLIAAILPMLITFAVQALGVAAAMGAVGVAAAGLLGGGLLGRGEGLADSMKQAKLRTQELKKELFEVFEPTFDSFAPISEQFMDMAPNVLKDVATSMKGLEQFDDTVFDSFEGLSEWTAEAIDKMVELEPILSQLAMRFGKITGTKIIDFLEWLSIEAYENQDLLISLGATLVQIAKTIYNASKAVSRLVVEMKPLFNLFEWISTLLNNDMLIGLGKVIASTYIMVKAVTMLAAAVRALNAAMAKNPAMFAAMAGLYIATEAMNMGGSSPGPSFSGGSPTGYGGGSPGGSGPSSPGGSTYIFNYDGPGTHRDMNRFENSMTNFADERDADEKWRGR